MPAYALKEPGLQAAEEDRAHRRLSRHPAVSPILHPQDLLFLEELPAPEAINTSGASHFFRATNTLYPSLTQFGSEVNLAAQKHLSKQYRKQNQSLDLRYFVSTEITLK